MQCLHCWYSCAFMNSFPVFLMGIHWPKVFFPDMHVLSMAAKSKIRAIALPGLLASLHVCRAFQSTGFPGIRFFFQTAVGSSCNMQHDETTAAQRTAVLSRRLLSCDVAFFLNKA